MKLIYSFSIIFMLFSTSSFAQDEAEKAWKKQLNNMSICPFYDLSVTFKHEDEVGKGRSNESKIQELNFSLNQVIPQLESKKQIMYSERMTKEKFAACWVSVKNMKKYRDELINKVDTNQLQNSSNRQLCEAQKATCFASCPPYRSVSWKENSLIVNGDHFDCKRRCESISCY